MISKISITFLLLCCLMSVSQNAPLVESGITLPDGYQSRAAWCQNVLGIQVCVDAMINGTELRVIFKVAGATIFDKIMDPTAPEYCLSKLGVKICLKAAFSSNDVCFSVKGSAPLIGSTTVKLGCINF